VPKLDWDEHKLEVGGLVKKPHQFSMQQLKDMPNPQEFSVTLTCDGNRRKELNMIKRSAGKKNHGEQRN
jgi:nitrate reductase (NAD(P)H)